MIHRQANQQSHFPVNWAIICPWHDSMYRVFLYGYDFDVAFDVVLPSCIRMGSVWSLLSLSVANEALHVQREMGE